ncbi:MAG: HupE/UreJ family protein, partial [Chthoniobacteraceae bacterium]
YVLSKLEVTSGGKTLTGSITKITPPPLYGAIEQTHFQYEIAYPRKGDTGEVAVRQTMLQDLPLDETGQPWDISYVVRFKSPGSDAVSFLLVAPGARVVIPSASAGNTGLSELPPAPVDAGRTMRDYFHHGFVHILTGYDHLLFVSALVLGALTFWQLFKVIAAFTIAHTITLALSVLDLVRLPSSIVEPIIAGSIIFVAVENLFWPQRAQSKLRLAIAFAFGLVHGLGFAGGLLEAMEGLPALGLGLALAAFSVGVEAGHLAVVIPLFAIIQLVRSRNATEATPLWRRWASGAISLCGVYYFVGALGGW